MTNKIFDKWVGVCGVVRRVGEAQDIVNLPVREADLILSALQEVLPRFTMPHALGQFPQASLAAAHQPLLQSFHPRYGILNGCKRNATQLGVEPFQTLAHLLQEVRPPRLDRVESNTKALDRLVGFSIVLSMIEVC